MATAPRKAVVACAITGSVQTPTMPPRLPVTPDLPIPMAAAMDGDRVPF